MPYAAKINKPTNEALRLFVILIIILICFLIKFSPLQF